MTSDLPSSIIVVGAGAAGLMAARELARAGKPVTILEARERIGGRIWALPAADFGYSAEAGAEFVHGEAEVTRMVLREAGLSLAPMTGIRWNARAEETAGAGVSQPGGDEAFHRALMALKTDMPIATFLETRFGDPGYAALRHSVLRMVEGYDAADPRKASTFALRDEWMGEGVEQQGRVAEGYGAMLDFLAAECRRHGATIHHGALVTAIEAMPDGVSVRCRDGSTLDAGAVVLTVPLPLLSAIKLPPDAHAKLAAVADIGFGNVVKILLRFKTGFWTRHKGKDLSNLSFLFGDAKVPTWWTQHPDDHPVLTGWFAGPKADTVSTLDEEELIAMGIASLAHLFETPEADLRKDLVAARAVDWGQDSLARGAYSYATPETRAAQALLARPDDSGVFFSGEALYAGHDMGTVEAALASGRDTARTILAKTKERAPQG